MSVPLISGDLHAYFPKNLSTVTLADIPCILGFGRLLKDFQRSPKPEPGTFEAYKYDLTIDALKDLATASGDLYRYQQPAQFLQKLKETLPKGGVLNQVATALDLGDWSSVLVMHELGQKKNAAKTLTRQIAEEAGPAPSRNEMLLVYKQPQFAEQAELAFNSLTHSYYGKEPVGDQILATWHKRKTVQPEARDDIAVRNAAVAFYEPLATISAELAAAEAKTPGQTTRLVIQAQKLAGVAKDVAEYCVEIGHYLDPGNRHESYAIKQVLAANQEIFAAVQEVTRQPAGEFAVVHEIADNVRQLFGRKPQGIPAGNTRPAF